MFGKEKVTILDGPTPLEYLPSISEDLGVDFYIKRDDLTPLAAGGNKLRKLEYALKEALDEGATMVVTTGGVQTNHGRLTAAAAAKFGMRCAIITVGDYPGELSANLLLDRILGADVYIEKGDITVDFDALVEKYIKKFEAEGEKVYFVPVGGSYATGMLGYADCAYELSEQAKAMGIEGARLVTTVGSLGTYIGLFSGLKSAGSDLRLTGVAIQPFGKNSFEKAVKLFGDIKDACGIEEEITAEDFDIETDYHFGAYNNAVKEVRDAILYMARKEGILLDPCYTGKTFCGIMDMIEKGKIEKGEAVIFLHTGGVPGLYTRHHREAFEEELIDGIHIAE